MPPDLPPPLPSPEDIDAALAAIDEELTHIDALLEASDNGLAITCHPHHHWWTAGGLAVASGLNAADILGMAGLLAQPWPSFCTRLAQAGGAAFLLRRMPAAIAGDRAILEGAGVALLQEHGLLAGTALPPRWQAAPKFGLGAPFVACGFTAADRDAWEGVWMLPLFDLEARGNAVAGGPLFPEAGMVLATLVTRARAELGARGAQARHLRARAAYYDDRARFAAWQADHPDHCWPTRLANARQGHLARTTAASLGVSLPALVRRGDAATWLDAHDANLRFTKED